MKKTARAIIVEDSGLMVIYRRKSVQGEVRSYFTLPGGHLENGEELEDCVLRELKEELNIDIEIIDYLGKMEIGEREEHYFLAKRVSGEPVLGGEELERCSDENYYEFRYLPLDEVMNSDILAIDFIKKAMSYE